MCGRYVSDKHNEVPHYAAQEVHWILKHPPKHGERPVWTITSIAITQFLELHNLTYEDKLTSRDVFGPIFDPNMETVK